jgi:hypothetical protein
MITHSADNVQHGLALSLYLTHSGGVRGWVAQPWRNRYAAVKTQFVLSSCNDLCILDDSAYGPVPLCLCL